MGALLPPAGALALERLFSPALEALTEAKAAAPTTFLARSAARLAGVSVESPASTSETGVQCALPWAGHECGSRELLPVPAAKSHGTAAEYLQNGEVGIAMLESFMDAALQAISAATRGETLTEEEWQRRGALCLLKEAGLVEGPTRVDSSTQCERVWISHQLR